LKQERDDALTMVDAYRIAFDDQLSRNRSLIRHMTEMCTDLHGQSAGHRDKLESPVARLFRKGNNPLLNRNFSSISDFISLFSPSYLSKASCSNSMVCQIYKHL